jgi:crotonobetainyl-CoA:carnitine CoA-transferase CaiB-like acyl-CoA transferase
MEQSNRGKRSVGIDIGHPEGRRLLLDLAAKADVFLTNFLPPARRKLGIELEDVRAVNPRVIYVRGHGQGAHGPDAEKGGYDAASFWSRGGIAHALTRPDADAPTMQRAAFGDSIGAMTVAGGIAAALFRRERTGEPSVVDVSLLGTAMWVLAPDIVMSKLTDKGMPAFDRREAPNPIVNSYRTKDGRWIFLNMLQPDRYWADFCRHLGREDLIDDARFKDGLARFQNRQACVAELDAVFASRTFAEWRARLDTAEGVWAPMQSAREVHDDPQAAANGYFAEVDRGDGRPFRLVASPVRFDDASPALRSAPEHAQHTEEILLEHGLSWEAIARLKETGAIA